MSAALVVHLSSVVRLSFVRREASCGGTLVPLTPNPFTIMMILYLRVVFGHYIVIIYFINFKLLETLCELLCVSLIFPQFLI